MEPTTLPITLPKPEPSSGIASYNAVMRSALIYDKRRAQNYMHFLAANGVTYLPVKLDIENVSRCNFKCTMCAVAGWKKGKRADDMSLECFKRLIDEQYGLVEIKLNGLGEALMQGDDYFEMIRYARSRKIWVRMTTNASLLHMHRNYQKLIDSDVNEIDISIDGADKKTFEAIRVGSTYRQVIANCKLLNDYTDSLGIVRTKMWTLVQEGNAHNLLAHVRLAAELGFRHLVFSLSMHGWGDEELGAKNTAAMRRPDNEMLTALIVEGLRVGVRVAFWDVADKFTSANPCPWPFTRAVVTSDSRVTPCCMIGDPDKYEIKGGETFSQIWHGKAYNHFRAMHLSGNVPDVCKGCYKKEGSK